MPFLFVISTYVPFLHNPLFESPYSDGSTGARSSEELGSAVGGEPKNNRWDPADPAVINHESSIIGTWWYDDHDSNVGKWPTLDLGYICILKSEGKPQNSWFSRLKSEFATSLSPNLQAKTGPVDPSWSPWHPFEDALKDQKDFSLGPHPWHPALSSGRAFPTPKTMAVQQRSPRSRHGCCWILCSQRLQVFLLIWRICL